TNMPRAKSGTAAILALVVALVPASAHADYQPGLPPGIDPGIPAFSGPQDPVPPEPAPFDPSTSALGRIFDADVAAGGTSYWFDRVLERPFLSNQDTYLYTRGRALYMYTHNAGALGFGGGYAYRERPTGNNQNLYTVAVSDASFAETTADRKQYPSHWSST